MSQHVPEIYRKYCLKLIEQGLQAAVGLPPQVVTDESLFKQTVVEPGWKLLPQPLRLFGRDRLRWDDFLLTVRRSVYLAAAGKVTLRSDAVSRIDAAIDPFFSSKPAAPAVPAASTPRPSAAAIAIAVPVAPVSKEPPAAITDEPVVGIDLGTTYSVISFLDSFGRPTSIPNAAGDFITPSVVLFDDGTTVVGKEAVLAAAMEPEKVADCAKRDMGTAHYRRKINGELLPPEVISSIILRSLKADAERKFNQPVRNAVITVPAYFDESRRQATFDAGKLAGFNVLDIINEPTAAAIAFGYQAGFINRQVEAASDKPLRVLVYDLGGGTFDVTIVEIQGSSFKTIATDGDVLLGGKDWDEKIVEIGARAFAEVHREDPRSHPGSNQELWQLAEAAKKTLTERPKATLYVNHLGTRVKVEITRQEFEEATSPLLGRTRTTTEIVVRQAGLTWAEIDKVLLVGGSTRMPAVVRMLEDISGRPPERSLSADEAVSHGAALYADLLLRRSGKKAGKAGFSVTNVNSHSLGIVGVDPVTGRKKAQVLIPKNTALPHSVKATFKTHKDGQKDIVIRVVEGESERPEACSQVGVCTVDNLPPKLPKGWPIVVQYHYEEDGLLFVTAHVKGVTDAMTTTFQRDNRLSEAELKMWSQYVAVMS